MIEYYLGRGNTVLAQARYDDLPDRLDLDPKAERDWEIYHAWLNLGIGLAESGRHWDDLNATELATLETLATTRWMYHAGRKAMVVLNIWYGGNYFVQAVYAGSPYRSTVTEPCRVEEENEWMLVFPNPASDDLQISIDLKELSPELCTLWINDLNGRSVDSFAVKYPRQQFALDVRKWTPGNYLVTLAFDGKKISSTCFNVVH